MSVFCKGELFFIDWFVFFFISYLEGNFKVGFFEENLYGIREVFLEFGVGC